MFTLRDIYDRHYSVFGYGLQLDQVICDFFLSLGDFDLDLFKKNMRFAVDQYISRVDDTPAMGTTIKLFRGVENSVLHKRRADLLIFLRGSKAAKDQLKDDKPILYEYFEKIWKFR